jgi:hypothetical protein
MGIISAAVVLMIGLALLPTLLEKVNDIDQQTRAHCEHQGSYFTQVNTAEDWTGTTIAVKAGTANACAVGAAVTATQDLYAPDGSLVRAQGSAVAADANFVTASSNFVNESGNDGWHTVVAVVSEQASLMRLVAGVLPVVAVIGVLGAGAMLFRGAMMKRGSMG